MKKFKVSGTNVRTFVNMMREMCPVAYKNNNVKFIDDEYSAYDYAEVTLMSDKEMRKYYKTGGLSTIGHLYEVIGGARESEQAGYGWYFRIGEIVECIDANYIARGDEVVRFSSKDRNKTQVIPKILLGKLIKKHKKR